MLPFGPARRLPVALVLLAFLAVPARAQQKNLTLDDLYDPAKRVNFGSGPGTYTWLNDKEYVKLGSARGGSAPATVALTRVDAETGVETPLLIRRSWKLLSRRFPAFQQPTRFSLAPAKVAEKPRSSPAPIDRSR